MNKAKRIITGCLGGLCAAMLLVLVAGCASTSAEREARMERGYVYYCDGSGGGSALRNYSSGVRKGLVEAGYPGSGEMFPWHTGLGVTADHTSSVRHKRSKGEALARQAQEYSQKYPDAPVTFMGLSAGTAIVIYGLEALPKGYQIDNAFLLSPSVSANYDLTDALGHVDHRMYVFVSEKDGVLRHLLPAFGTADRESGSAGAAGLNGFQRPAGSTSDTQTQYAKLVHVRWDPSFRRKGHAGGHTDVVSTQFVRDYIAPLVMDTPTRVAKAKPAGKVRNPGYERWANASPGAWVRIEGYQVVDGQRQSLYIKITLREKQDDVLVEEWAYFADGANDRIPERVQEFVERAWIEPAGSPRTHPDSTVKQLPAESIKVRGKTLKCDGASIDAPADFPDWGRDVDATLYSNDSVPGKIVRAHVKSHKGQQPFEFFGEVVEWGDGGK